MESKYLWAFGCFIFLVATAYLLNANDALEQRLESTRIELEHKELDLQLAGSNIEQLQRELFQARTEFANTENELNLTKEELASTKEELNLTLAALGNTLQKLEDTKAEFELLSEEIKGLNESIHSSIQWFRENAVLPSSMDYLYRKVDSKCVNGRTLNLACAIFVMEREIPFRYKNEYPDKLYSLLEMEKRRSGDCEDYSLLLKALLNRFKADWSNVELETWERGGGKYIIYEEGRTIWYVPGHEKAIGNLREVNPYVVCFVTGFIGSHFEGHCIVAVGSGIEKAGGIPPLDGVETFEPQLGEYTGRIGVNYHLCKDGEKECGKTPGDINFIIADNDLYHFQDGKWTGYEIYKQKAEELEQRVSTYK